MCNTANLRFTQLEGHSGCTPPEQVPNQHDACSTYANTKRQQPPAAESFHVAVCVVSLVEWEGTSQFLSFEECCFLCTSGSVPSPERLSIQTNFPLQ